MSTAIVIGRPVAGSPLDADLRALGFTVRAPQDPGAVREELGRVPTGERIAVVDARFTGHRQSLRLALTDPRFPAAAVPGALAVGPAGRAALTAALASVPAEPAAEADTPLTDRLAEAVDASGTAVHRPALGALVAEVPESATAAERARAAVAAVDGEQVRLADAVKSRDGFFTTHCVSPYSRYIARWCAERGLTPNQVTTASLLTALVAAGCAATGTRAGFVAAGLLLLASFVLDCVDGQLARYALKYSTLGAWLDATFDRAKEYAFYAGLALGAARGGEDVWGLALAAMVLQTARHIVDFSFNETVTAQPGASRAAALSGRLDAVGWTVWARRMIVLPIGERWALIAVLTALTTPRVTFVVLLAAGAFAACYTTAGRVLRSARRPGGAAAGDGGATALAALADSGPLAESAARTPATGRTALGAPLWAAAGVLVLLGTLLLPGTAGTWAVVAAAVWYALCAGRAVAAPLDHRLDWLLPPLFRVAEYSTVLILALHAESPAALPAAFGLVAICAYHHYDTVYRLRGGAGAPPRGLVLAAGGHEGRTLLVVLAAALWLGGSGFPVALTVLTGALTILVLTESIRFWVSSQAPAVHDETGEPT
ncbi:DUF5941 domain-containing protein [Streptomyces bohaiensis]|uniref:DUF5941 domain-containing protein n=1 Tax=Streptomyces bohaiensis TaxID=1431344 RepID=UPI003B771FF1